VDKVKKNSSGVTKRMKQKNKTDGKEVKVKK
jgi:hypothetical protein